MHKLHFLRETSVDHRIISNLIYWKPLVPWATNETLGESPIFVYVCRGTQITFKHNLTQFSAML